MDASPPVETRNNADRFWNLYSRYYDCVFQLMPYRKLLWDTYEALDLRPGMRVLDAGCGTGNFEFFISEKNHPPVSIDAVDFSPRMLERAAIKCAGLPHVDFRQADLGATLPFEDETFDRIVSINVFYALPDWDATMTELLRVLKPEGKLVLTSSGPDFRAAPLLRDHFGRIKNIWGVRRKMKAVTDILTASVTTGVGSAALNAFVIDKRESEGAYRSPGELELRAFFENHVPLGVGEYVIGDAWAEQNFLATATKAAAECAT